MDERTRGAEEAVSGVGVGAACGVIQRAEVGGRAAGPVDLHGLSAALGQMSKMCWYA